MKTLLEFLVKGKINNNTENLVDLALPSHTLWATCNLGSKIPEEPGDYYAWGETSKRKLFDWNSYKFGYKDSLTKYNENDNKHILDEDDDVAFITSGGKLHIPSIEQFEELTNQEHTDIKSHNIYIEIISKLNGNSIIIPCCGYWANRHHSSNCIELWTNEQDISHLDCAYSYDYDDIWGRNDMNSTFRQQGLQIRPCTINK